MLLGGLVMTNGDLGCITCDERLLLYWPGFSLSCMAGTWEGAEYNTISLGSVIQRYGLYDLCVARHARMRPINYISSSSSEADPAIRKGTPLQPTHTSLRHVHMLRKHERG